MRRFITLQLLLTFLFFSTTSFSQELSPAHQIANAIKATLDDWTASESKARMTRHYQEMRLMDPSGNWKAEELRAISKQLLPENIDRAAVLAFIDEIAAIAEQNPYLVDIMEQAQGMHFPTLMDKVEQEGTVVFPDMVAHALVQQHLTTAMYNDWRILEVCENVWKDSREASDIKKHLSTFEFAKLYSVEILVDKYIEFHKSGKVNPKFMKGLLPMNIMEAMAVDVTKGNWDNVRTGWTLTVNKPGATTYNEKTEEGPSRWSEDGKAVVLGMPLPLEWADLYAVWNLAFVTTYEHWPYFFVKLLIPQVNDYEDKPGAYIYKRVLALYTYIHYGLITRADYAEAGKEKINWGDDDFTQFLGKVNKQSALDYEEALKEAKNE